jgi:uncharacterized membrane protein YfcA
LLSLVIILALVALGAVASFASILGAGGGIYVLLLLVSLVNEPPGKLVGSVYVMFLASAIVGSLFFSSAKMIDYKTGIMIAISCIPGILIGTYLGLSFSTVEFKVILGAVTVALSATLFLESVNLFSGVRRNVRAVQQSDEKKGTAKTITDRSGRVFVYYPKPIIGMVVGGIAGILAGSVGGGPAVLLAPAMMVFVGMPPQIALATLRIVLLALNTTVVAAHLAVNEIDLQYGIWLAVGGMIGTIMGARVIYRARPVALKKVVAISLAVFGIYLIVSSLV